MIDNKYLELIHRDIDKDITPQEKEQLEIYLNINPEAAELLNDLRETEVLLDSLPHTDPSENLKKRIVNSIDPDRYAPVRKHSAKRFMSGLFNGTKPVFALGVVASLVLIGLFISNPNLVTTFDHNDVSGTMGLRSAEEVALLDVDVNGVTGSIQVIKGTPFEGTGYSFGFSVDLSSAGDYQFEINYDPSEISVEEIISRNNLVTDQNAGSLTISSGGHSFYSVLFSSTETSGAFAVKVLRDGNEIYGQQVLVK